MDTNIMSQTIPKFNEKGTLNGHALYNEWIEWKAAFEIWAEAMNMQTQKQKFSWLLVAGGREIQRIYNSTPQSKEEVLEIKFPWIEVPLYYNAISRLDSYFEAKSNPRLERQLLNELNQDKKEQFNAYLVRLRTQAMRCGFDEKRIDEEVFFQIMRGARSEKVKQYAATETGKSIEQLISFAINEEIKQQQRQESEIVENSPEQSVAAIKKFQKPFGNYNYHQKQNFGKCNRCGSAKHIGGTHCPAMGEKCRFCNVIGHFARVCMKKRKGERFKSFNDRERRPKKDTIGVINEDEDWDTEDSKQKNNAVIRVNIGGVNLEMLIDSGSPINTLTEQDFTKLNEGNARMFDLSHKVTDKFTGYASVSTLICVAKFVTLVKISNDRPQCYEEFFVIKNATQSLLSKSASERLRILRVGLSVNRIEEIKDFPKIPNVKIKLVIDESVEPKQKTYNCIPRAQEEKVLEIIQRMEQEGIIEKVEGYSKWISPLIVVPKGTNDIRCCVDMREPNQAIKRVLFPMPTLEFILSKLANCTVFTKIDIKSAYHHVELHEDSRYITVFLTQKGVMQFKRLVFGLCSAPEIFQRIMSQLIMGIEGTFCFLDDIIVAGKTEQEHDERLRKVLMILEKNNLTLNEKKCSFRMKQIDFLGMTISENEVKPSQTKIEAVKNFKKPNTVEEVRSFLGLVTYLGKFVPNLANVCEPLSQIIRNKVMSWELPQQEAFESLKHALCKSVLKLGMFNPRHETIVYTDASPTSLGSAIVQRHQGISRVIEFAAKTLTATERKYPQAQREALAAVWAVERFYYYLSGIKFTLCTDYRALQFIFKGAFRINKRAVSRAESWALRLQHYNFDIKYIPGKDNIADPLSRLYEGNDRAFEEESRLFVCNIESWQQVVSLNQIAEATKDDTELQAVIQALECGDWSNVLPKYRAMRSELSVVDGILYKDFLVVIPKLLSENVLEYAHKGHPGEVTMKRILRERVWWPGMAKDVHNKIKTCLGCALVSRANPPIPMSRTNIPEAAWVDIAIDFFKAGPLGELLVVIDYYSRYVVARKMNGTDADRTIKCLQDIFRIFGNPLTLKSDNGPPFSSSKFSEFCKAQAIELIKSPPHNPSSNGLVERVNRNLKRILQIGSIMKENLAKTLHEFLEVYNKRPSSVTNLSPFEMMFKRKPRTLLPLGTVNNYWTETEARERDAVEKLKGKIYSDNKRMAKVSEITVGDFVMIKDIMTGCKLKCRYLDKKYQVIDRKFAVLTLKDPDGNICKRHVDHAKLWPRENKETIKEIVDNTVNDCSPRKKRKTQLPARFRLNSVNNA